jgi:hypothetical protein
MSGLAYLVAGWLLVFRYNSIQGDALSHVNNGALTMFSRDPHLAAVGFVWNPLPSFLAMPLLLLRPLFPALLSKGYAGNIVTAASGAAAVGVLLLILRDWGLNRWVRWALTLTFALHPLVFYSGANGMTEAPYLLLLLLACRYLARWLRTRAAADLVACGVSLGVGYFVRYEVLAAGAAIAGLVFIARFAWTEGNVRVRAREAAADLGIVAAPIAFAFVAWAVASWILVGSAFEQFTSQYGNAAQLHAMRESAIVSSTGPPLSGRDAVHYALRQLLLLSTALPIAAIVSLVVAWRRRESAVLVPWAAFGSILAFEIVAYARGQTASWLRYYIVAVPFIVLSAATLLVDRRPDAPDERVSISGRTRSRTRVAIVSLAAVAMGAAGLAGADAMLHDHDLAREQSVLLEAVVDRRSASETSREALNQYKVEKEVADYLTSLRPGRGSVLIDSFYGFTITTQSTNLKMFVVTSDRDFKEVVADPVTFHVRYILVPDTTHGKLDAINVAYPTMYDSGAGIATLLREFKSNANFADWRVYEIDDA